MSAKIGHVLQVQRCLLYPRRLKLLLRLQTNAWFEAMSGGPELYRKNHLHHQYLTHYIHVLCHHQWHPPRPPHMNCPQYYQNNQQYHLWRYPLHHDWLKSYWMMSGNWIPQSKKSKENWQWWRSNIIARGVYFRFNLWTSPWCIIINSMPLMTVTIAVNY